MHHADGNHTASTGLNGPFWSQQERTPGGPDSRLNGGRSWRLWGPLVLLASLRVLGQGYGFGQMLSSGSSPPLISSPPPKSHGWPRKGLPQPKVC